MAEADSLRIGLFTYSTKPRGGVVHTLELARALDRLGQRVVVHALDESGTGLYRRAGVATRLVSVSAAPSDPTSFVRRRIDEYVRGLRATIGAFDVYHAQDGISANALATLAEDGVIPGFVRTVHHLDAFSDPTLSALQDRSVTAAQRLYVVSDLWRRRLARDYRRKAFVLPNGVDLARFRVPAPQERTALRSRLGFGDAPVFLAIGGIERRKNTLRILEAFARVRSGLPSARLIIAGGASIFDHSTEVAAFERVVTERRFDTEAVERRGILGDDEIAGLIRAADGVVFPSIAEGFGLVALEALASGTPLVASAIAPFTEYLDDSVAMLVDPDDVGAIANAMRRVLEPSVREMLVPRGLALAQRFDWSNSARAHVRSYRAARSEENDAA